MNRKRNSRYKNRGEGASIRRGEKWLCTCVCHSTPDSPHVDAPCICQRIRLLRAGKNQS